MSRQNELNTAVEPVKWIPPKSRLASTASVICAEFPVMKLITPGGTPASSNTFAMYQLESIAVRAGFHTTVLPMIAGEEERLPPMDVKLKGVIA